MGRHDSKQAFTFVVIDHDDLTDHWNVKCTAKEADLLCDEFLSKSNTGALWAFPTNECKSSLKELKSNLQDYYPDSPDPIEDTPATEDDLKAALVENAQLQNRIERLKQKMLKSCQVLVEDWENENDS